jgi:hypothetical protein
MTVGVAQLAPYGVQAYGGFQNADRAGRMVYGRWSAVAGIVAQLEVALEHADSDLKYMDGRDAQLIKTILIFYERESALVGNGFYCTMVGLGTSTEPIGEGPKDT